MKSRVFATIALAVVVTFVAGNALATTIGFVGANAVNADIPANYGSNVAADGTGWTVSDGTGATPDVTLYWGGGGSGGTGWDWEFHNANTFQHVEALHAGGAWDATSPPTTNAVAQLQDYRSNGALEVQFSVPADKAVVINSFDIGNATNQDAFDGVYGFVINLVKDSNSSVVWTHTTPLWGLEQVPRVLREESVAVNYAGELGESYTLTFTRYNGGNAGNNEVFRSGLDNLSFSQVPEPSTFTLMALCSLGLLPNSRRSR